MITSVSLNPSIDRTLGVENFTTGGLNRVLSQTDVAAGKGVNVALAAAALGADSECIGFMYREGGSLFEKRLHEGGVRGLRFSVWNPNNAVVSFDDCKPLSERVKHLGWNMQLHMSAAQIAQQADVIRSLDCKVVIDHMGRLDPALGVKDPAYSFLCEMVDRGNTWIKLSGPYLNTKTGEPWEDATRTAIAIAEFAPERVVWGTDFPHVTEKVKPDEFELTEMIPLWFPSQRARELALRDNPQELYGF